MTGDPLKEARATDARIAKLEAEKNSAISLSGYWEEYAGRYRRRAEQSEATIERLKVCGNCEHWSSSLYECGLVSVHDIPRPWSGDSESADPCHFAPSRWAERITP